jgi:prepilin-type processing-associated H-X9-DG protein
MTPDVRQRLWASYGFNGFPNTLFSGFWGSSGRNIDEIKSPRETIMFQDAYEHMMDSNGDMLYNFYQWPNKEFEYIRHLDNSNVMWVDGHASSEFYNSTTDAWGKKWYRGY